MARYRPPQPVTNRQAKLPAAVMMQTINSESKDASNSGRLELESETDVGFNTTQLTKRNQTIDLQDFSDVLSTFKPHQKGQRKEDAFENLRYSNEESKQDKPVI